MKRAKQTAVQQVAKTFQQVVETFFFLAILIVSGLVAGGCAMPTGGTDDDTEGGDMAAAVQQIPQMKKGPDGWSANGVLHALVYNEVQSCQANFPESGNYSVQFAVTGPGGINNGVQAEAFITWSVAGNNVTRRVSITNGATVSGMGQAVKISMYDVSVLATPGTPYGVSVQVVKGLRPDTENPPFLVPHAFVDENATPQVIQPYETGSYLITADGFAGTGNGTGFITLPIPQDAGVVSAYVLTALNIVVPAGYQAQGTSPVIPNDMLQVESINVATATHVVYDPRISVGWVPIAAGATVLRLFNFMPAGQPAVRFSVFLGIDG
jgi:hypothetical protein